MRTRAMHTLTEPTPTPESRAADKAFLSRLRNLVADFDDVYLTRDVGQLVASLAEIEATAVRVRGDIARFRTREKLQAKLAALDEAAPTAAAIQTPADAPEAPPAAIDDSRPPAWPSPDITPSEAKAAVEAIHGRPHNPKAPAKDGAATARKG